MEHVCFCILDQHVWRTKLGEAASEAMLPKRHAAGSHLPDQEAMEAQRLEQFADFQRSKMQRGLPCAPLPPPPPTELHPNVAARSRRELIAEFQQDKRQRGLPWSLMPPLPPPLRTHLCPAPQQALKIQVRELEQHQAAASAAAATSSSSSSSSSSHHQQQQQPQPQQQS